MIFNSGYNLNPCGWTERYRAAIQPRRVLIALLTRWINVSLPHSSPLHDRPEPKKQDVQTLKRNLALWLRVGPLWQRNLLLFFFFFFVTEEAVRSRGSCCRATTRPAYHPNVFTWTVFTWQAQRVQSNQDGGQVFLHQSFGGGNLLVKCKPLLIGLSLHLFSFIKNCWGVERSCLIRAT